MSEASPISVRTRGRSPATTWRCLKYDVKLSGAAAGVEDASAGLASRVLFLAPVPVVEADNQTKAMLGGEVEDVCGRERVHANRVQAGLCHGAKVLIDFRRLGKRLAVPAGLE